MVEIKNKLDDSKPIYLQIKEYIEDSILEGSIEIGERVPSTNEFAKFYKINPATARQGINELVNEGILRKQRGVGMFVTNEAKALLMTKRRGLFYEHFIIPLKSEAGKLNITQDELVQMLKQEGEVK